MRQVRVLLCLVLAASIAYNAGKSDERETHRANIHDAYMEGVRTITRQQCRLPNEDADVFKHCKLRGTRLVRR